MKISAVSAWWIAAAAVAVVYALAELPRVTVAVPQLRRQVPDWWRSFFTPPLFDFQRRFRSAGETAAEVDFLERHLGLSPGDRVLDVPCGDGRTAVELAGRGYRAVGVDVAAAVLGMARRRAAGAGVEAEWRQGDMRQPADLGPAESFQGACNLGNSFGYFGDEGDRQALAAVFAALAPGGGFVLESRLVAETVLPLHGGRDWRAFGGDFVLMEEEYDPVRGELTVAYTLIHEGRPETRRARYRVYSCRELLGLFESVGFTGMEIYGSLDDDPYRVADEVLWLVAHKPAGSAAGTNPPGRSL